MSVVKKEILGIDLLRFAAAAMIAIHDLGFWNFYSEDAPYLTHLLGSAELANSTEFFGYFGWVGVQIFFVISGFVIAYSAEKATAFSFFRSRFVRLMPSLWICALVAVPASLLVFHESWAQTLKLFVKTATLYPRWPWIESVIWTLPVEVSFYVAVFALIAARQFKRIGVFALTVGGCSSVYWLFYIAGRLVPGWHMISDVMIQITWSAWIMYSLARHGCYFALGICLWLIMIKKKPYPYVYFLPLFLAGGFGEIWCMNDDHIAGTHILQPLLVPYALWLVSLAAMILSIRHNAFFAARLATAWGTKGQSAIKWLGKLTYPLYLIHLPAAFLGILALKSLGFGQSLSWLGGLAIAFIGAAIVTTWLEPKLQTFTRKAIDRIQMRTRPWLHRFVSTP